MKTLVIYKSKTGFIKKYAEWIAEELSADIFDVSKVSTDMLIAYDTVIYGGGLYAEYYRMRGEAYCSDSRYSFTHI